MNWNAPLPLPADGVCTQDGWCTTSGALQPLDHVWGTSATDVWASATGLIEHWDGTRYRGWSAMTVNSPAIGGSGANDVWFGGTLHWDGAALSKAAKPVPGDVSAFWFAAPNDGWAVGPGGAWHWDGAGWTSFPTGAPSGFAAIDGSSSTDVWAVGGAYLKHWDGVAWSDPSPAPPLAVGDVFPSAIRVVTAGDVWVGAWHGGGGGAWSSQWPAGAVAPSSSIRSVSGTASNNVFFVTPTKNYRWDGTIIREDVTGSSAPCDVCGLCSSGFDTPTGARFITTALGPSPTATSCPLFQRYYDPFRSVVQVGPAHPELPYAGRFVAWGNDGTLGLVSSLVKSGPGTPPAGASTVWGPSPSDTAFALAGYGPSDIWVSGYSANVASHWDGTSWTYKPLPAKATSGVGAASPTSAWVITSGWAAYFDGVSWTNKGAVPAKTWKAIWGSGPTDAWLVGDGIAHWDGMTWTQVAGPGNGFVDVRGFTPTDVVAVVNDGTVWRWNGVTWSAVPGSKRGANVQPFFVIESTNSIWTTATGGLEPSVLHFDGACWRSEIAGNAGRDLTNGLAIGANRLWVSRPQELFSRPR